MNPFSVTNAAVFISPFDAAGAGGKIFFTAISATDGSGRLFAVTPPASTVTQISTDATSPFLLPLGVATPTDPSDSDVFVADPAATTANGDVGAIFEVPALGGSSTVLTGTIGYQPRGIVVASVGSPTPADTMFFTGNDPTTGEANVYTLAPGSSAPPSAVLSSPSGLGDPSGVAADPSGNIFVVDTTPTAGTTGASVYEIFQGDDAIDATLATGLEVGYPAGLAVSADGLTLYISGRSATDGTDLIFQVGVSGGVTTSAPSGISSFVEPGGLHLVADGTVDFVDGLAGGSGTVYQINP